jgi:dTDP-4-amino-4,6-dideoxygalactose transaminase/acetyltransferase-like isoleucine patch superfamily enzyme
MQSKSGYLVETVAHHGDARRMSPVDRARTHAFVHRLALVESDDVGRNTRVWPFAHVMAGASVGSDCNIGEQAYVESGAKIGNNVTVKNGVAVWSGVLIEDGAFLGPNCVFTNDPNPRSSFKKREDELIATRVLENATIGANATILCGISIGRYAFVGAGAVVLRSVPDYGLVLGNPARQVGWMCACAHRLPLSASANEDTRCRCVRCGRSFVVVEKGLIESKRASGSVSATVPLADLRLQYAAIKHEIRPVIDEILESAQYVGGERLEKFEAEFAEYVGAKYCVGVSSGTSALELSLRAAGIKPGDEVIVPANSFIATAEAVSNVGATPVFADIDPTTFHLNVDLLPELITRKTKAVIPVHLYGQAMDLSRLEELAADHGFQIIEDAAQAQGARLHRIRVGGSGRPTCFSFYPAKNLGAYGDAGAITTDDREIASKVRLLRDHGSPAKYHHEVIGTNARLDNIQAGILSVKLRHLDAWNEMRRHHARAYAQGLAGAPVSLPPIPEAEEHVFHLFVVRCRQRDALREYLSTRNINTGIHYPVPLHLTEAYAVKNLVPVRLPEAERAAEEIVSLPMYPELSEEQREHVVASVLEFLNVRSAAA